MTVDQIENQPIPAPGYNHAQREPVRRILRMLLSGIGFTLLAKLDRAEGLENIPAQGPAILMINHISFADSLVVLHAVPRNIVPMAKIEVYNYPVVSIFPRLWGVIPVRRDEVDRRAIQQSLEVLKAGEIVLVAPEGTRGVALQQGKEGIAYLASRSGAPVVPVAIEGTVGFPSLRGSPAWKTPGARLRFGRPFRYKAEYRRARSSDLRKMTDEAMGVLAALLPPERRGVYAALAHATRDTLELL
ncbi:MAG: lysophospholipid acyltransferase family protein [Chloroflexota bacterium]